MQVQEWFNRLKTVYSPFVIKTLNTYEMGGYNWQGFLKAGFLHGWFCLF
jgi:hypothetical protein